MKNMSNDEKVNKGKKSGFLLLDKITVYLNYSPYADSGVYWAPVGAISIDEGIYWDTSTKLYVQTKTEKTWYLNDDLLPILNAWTGV